MKRHKYTLIKYSKEWSKEFEVMHLTLNYIKKFNNFEELALTSRILTQKFFFLSPSKITKFCVITGRTRYTIKETLYSRQMFCARNSEGLMVGFFMSSW